MSDHGSDMKANRACVFCSYRGPSPIWFRFRGGYVITPVNPVAEGHRLFIPDKHITFPWQDELSFGRVMEAVAEHTRGAGNCNVIVNVGADAGQTIAHLHVHLVPRAESDGLKMPWSGQ